nr:hypothetical protein CFP56_39246 [Quercus suber]
MRQGQLPSHTSLVWGLPFDLIHEEAGWDIWKGLGKVIEVDSKALGSKQACFIRIHQEIPLDKPLRKGSYVADPKGEQVRVGFKYEGEHEMKECSRVTAKGCIPG